MSEGFLSRWSKRKQEVLQQETISKQGLSKQGVNQDATAPQALNTQVADDGALAANVKSPAQQTPAEPAAQALPTLADVEKLTHESDFKSFMTQGVPPEVRNAAVKKLFADPHFNVMDGLDIYIGDYNTPDPMPPGMLEKMVGAQFLGLVKNPEEGQADQAVAQCAPTAIENASDTAPKDIADTSSESEQNSAQHDHTPLRLQPDHAASDPEAGAGPG